MATFVSVLVLMMLSTMASAGDQWCLFGCPDFRQQADESISYEGLGGQVLGTQLSLSGPYLVIAGAESKAASAFECISITHTYLTSYEIDYRHKGIDYTKAIQWNVLESKLIGKIPKDLLNSPADDKEVQFTIVSNKEGLMVMKTCKTGFLSHWTSTYLVVDMGTYEIDIFSNMTGLLSNFEKEFCVNAELKFPMTCV